MRKIKNLINYLRYTPKKLVAIFAAVLLVALPFGASAGWFPARPIKDWNNPADRLGFGHVTFNSFINTPFYGDERAFFDARHSSETQVGAYKDQLSGVQPGEEVVLRTYIHNGANQSLNASGQGIAKNTKLRILLPTGTAKNLRTTSFISADNADPQVVSDTTDLISNQNFSVEYVPGSAQIGTAGGANGAKLSDSIVNSGALIGFDAINGQMPGCFEFQAIVLIRVKIKAPSLAFNKQVALEGQGFTDSVEAKPGDKVTWLLPFKNDGTQQLNNTLIRDVLPSGLSLVPGSVSLTDAAHASGLALTDGDLFDANGVNAGSYTAGSNGFIKFKTTIPSAEQLPECVTTFKNVATADADDVNPIEDSAQVVVRKDCAPPPPPEQPPVTPAGVQPGAPLPVTGPETALFGMLGSGTLGWAIRAYLRSRRGLLSALLDV